MVNMSQDILPGNVGHTRNLCEHKLGRCYPGLYPPGKLDLSMLSSAGVACVRFLYYSVVIGLLYMAHPDGCQHKFTFQPRPRPYPMRGHRLLCSLCT